MNQAPTGVEPPSSAQTSSGPQPPTETPEPSESLGLSGPRTPLGEPIDKLAAHFLSTNPVLWHKKYWFCLFIYGVLRGEDARLMLVRIEFEQSKVPGKLGIEIRRNFKQWRILEKSEHCTRNTVVRAINRCENPNLKKPDTVERYNRDLNTMLVDKGQKMKTYLHHLEDQMINCVLTGEFEAAFKIGWNLVKLRRAFRGEKKEARRRLYHGLSATPNRRRQTRKAIQVAWLDVSD